MRKFRDGVILVDGEWVPETEPVIPATARSVLYGAGCFETLLADHGRFLHPDRHLQRLQEGVAWLGGEALPIEPRELTQAARELLTRNGLMQGLAMLRVQASLLGARGYGDLNGQPVRISMQAAPWHHPDEPLRLTSVPVCVVPDRCRPAHLKLSNTLHYMDAARRALRDGYDDAILLTLDGAVAETSVSNLFWKRGEAVYTPDRSCDILPGQMRRIVVENLPGWSGLPVREGAYRLEELLAADLVWTTNSLRRIQPVAAVGQSRYTVRDPFYRMLKECLGNYIERVAE